MWLVVLEIEHYPIIETFYIEEEARKQFEEWKKSYKGSYASVYLCQVIESRTPVQE